MITAAGRRFRAANLIQVKAARAADPNFSPSKPGDDDHDDGKCHFSGCSRVDLRDLRAGRRVGGSVREPAPPGSATGRIALRTIPELLVRLLRRLFCRRGSFFDWSTQNMAQTGVELIAKCQAALATGMDFPTLWHEVLKGSPLVIGPPVQVLREGRASLEVRLLSGAAIVFDSATNRIVTG